VVFANDCSKMIFSEFPDFEQSHRWKDHLEFWGEDKPGLCAIFSTFSDYISDNLKGDNSKIDFIKVFDFVEMLMKEGDQETQDSAATCFLENLINFTSSSHVALPAKTFVYLLGPESLAYCKAWDEFTGVKTEGLWDDMSNT